MIFFLFFASLLISPRARAQSAELGDISRSQVFADANTSGSTLVTALYAGDMSVADFSQALNNFNSNFYAQGWISLGQFKQKKQEISDCADAQTQYLALTSDDARDAFRPTRTAKCGTAINFQALAASAPACVQTGALASGSQCCKGLKLGISLSLENSLSGKKPGETCSTHEDCRSKLCNIEEGSSSGTCGPVLTCLASAPLGGECSLENPNCLAGVCRAVDLGAEGVQCKADRISCSADVDCCSGKCSSGLCTGRYLCTDCVREGEKPAAGRKCCPGTILMEGSCELEFPPFILPTKFKSSSFWRRVLELALPSAHAADEVTTAGSSSTPKKKVVAIQGDDGLTKAQLDLLESAVKDCMAKSDKASRASCLRATYDKRKALLAQNNASLVAGRPVGETFTPEEYVLRYNIPSITPRTRSDVNGCVFNTVRDNWTDATNLQRNAELFTRAFEVSYSGRPTQDFWHLIDAQGNYHKDNIYTRTKAVMTQLRENRAALHDELKYLDLVMTCQCLYTFGPEKFSADMQQFFFTQCTGNTENKICRAGDQQDSLKLPDSKEEAYRQGQEFPNFVSMYLTNLEKVKTANTDRVRTDVVSTDASAAGVSGEEILVRWLRLRSCNQIDVFVDTEAIDTQLTGLVEDLVRARKPNPVLTKYWTDRLKSMTDAGVDKKIVQYFKDDAEKDLFYRGYVDTESKLSVHKKTIPTLLILIFALLLAVVAIALVAVAATLSIVAGSISGVLLLSSGIVLMSNGGSGSAGSEVMDKLIRDFPNPLVEDRLVEKHLCILGLFSCQTYHRILHWPAFTNGKGVGSGIPFTKKEERTCADTAKLAESLPGATPDQCSGMFKGVHCARSFYRPIPDAEIEADQAFGPWKEVLRDKVIMDPVFPEFLDVSSLPADFKWKDGFGDGFRTGCSSLGDGKNVAKDAKLKFIPDLSRYFDKDLRFTKPYQFDQDQIKAYKQAVMRYALCDKLKDCGAKYYDGKAEYPRGFADIFESDEQAELFANYVYQIHFLWRHLSNDTGIGYPLGYLENYFLALQYNVRLLSTLTIRRGIELDDAYTKYADDLAIRRAAFQTGAGVYGVTTGQGASATVSKNSFYSDVRNLGFPLDSSFIGTGGAGGIATGKLSGSSATSGSISDTSSALNAAARLAGRVAADNRRAIAFSSAIKGNAGAAARVASASKFFEAANSPTSVIGSLANPKDKSSYSGIGGVVNNSGVSGNATGKETSSSASSSTSSGPISGSVGFGTSNGQGAVGLGSAGFGSADSDAVDDKDLQDAARVTGLKEGEVKSMLEGSESDRRNLQGNDQDTLFGKVSKAYMRNLDRVLTRKRGPEATPEQRPSTGKDKEKEEIKRIFKQ